MYKQGYLITETFFLGTRTRKWHRLYGTKLYSVSLEANAYDDSKTCSFQILTDVTNAAITAKPGDTPFFFSIHTDDGSALEFQAENGDEMMQWINALRRCSNGGISRQREVDGQDKWLKELRVRDAANAPLLLAFLQVNDSCAECGAHATQRDVTWVR